MERPEAWGLRVKKKKKKQTLIGFSWVMVSSRLVTVRWTLLRRKCTVHCVQFSVYSSQRLVYSLQCTVISSQFTVFSSQFTVHSEYSRLHMSPKWEYVEGWPCLCLYWAQLSLATKQGQIFQTSQTNIWAGMSQKQTRSDMSLGRHVTK